MALCRNYVLGKNKGREVGIINRGLTNVKRLAMEGLTDNLQS